MPFFSALKRGWGAVTRGLIYFGEIVSSILMTVFYYTVFAVVAIPFRFIEHPFAPASGTSNFHPAKRVFATRKDFEQEF
jgi:hypothetical protein